MSFKKLLVIIFVTIVLLGLVFVKKNIQTRQNKNIEQEAQQASQVTLIKDLPEGFIGKIVLYTGDAVDNKISIVKNSQGDWSLESKFNVKAKKETVDNLFKKLNGLKGEMRADSKDVLGDFKIDDNQALHIILSDSGDKQLNHILVSYLRAAWNKNFVRLANNNKIILSDVDLLSTLSIYDKDEKLDSNPFADFKIASISADTVEKITLNLKDKPTITLQKSQNIDKTGFVWSFLPAVNNEEVDAAKINEFIGHVNNAYAKDAVDPNLTTYGFDKPTLSVILTGVQDKEIINLTIGSYLESEKTYYVKVSPANFVFKVQDFYINNLKKEKNYFLNIQEKLLVQDKTPVAVNNLPAKKNPSKKK